MVTVLDQEAPNSFVFSEYFLMPMPTGNSCSTTGRSTRRMPESSWGRGGIVMQLQDYYTGFLVHSPEGCAFRIRYLLHRPEMSRRLGQKAKEFVRQHFLMTRNGRDYLTLMILCKQHSGRAGEL